jgi:hypothetical protein
MGHRLAQPPADSPALPGTACLGQGWVHKADPSPAGSEAKPPGYKALQARSRCQSPAGTSLPSAEESNDLSALRLPSMPILSIAH